MDLFALTQEVLQDSLSCDSKPYQAVAVDYMIPSIKKFKMCVCVCSMHILTYEQKCFLKGLQKLLVIKVRMAR